MNENEIFNNLCVYDERNPCYIPFDGVFPEKCHCDNCFYGRNKLSLEILRLQDENYEKMNPKITQISYYINLSETQWNNLGEKCKSDFLVYMENSTSSKKMYWARVANARRIFFTIPFHYTTEIGSLLKKVVEVLTESLGSK